MRKIQGCEMLSFLIGAILLILTFCLDLDMAITFVIVLSAWLLGLMFHMAVEKEKWEQKMKNTTCEERRYLRLRRRGLWVEESCKLSIGFVVCWWFLCLMSQMMGEKTYSYMKIIGAIIWSGMVLHAIWKNAMYNRLIREGKLILATINHDSSRFGAFGGTVKCSYFDETQGRLYAYKGRYTNAIRSFIYDKYFRKERVIPVLIDERNDKKSLVLIRELMFGYRENMIPKCMTHVVRTINLLEVENGDMLSDKVNFF